MWCHEKCICQEQNRKVYCTNVNRNDVFRQPEITREIVLSNSFVGMGWLTTVFNSLDSVRISDSVILDCNVMYKVTLIGACETSTASITPEISYVPHGIESKGITPSLNSVPKSTLIVTVCGVIFTCTLISTITVFIIKRKLENGLLRVREERMAEMGRTFGFDFNENDEEEANRQAEEKEIKKRTSRKKWNRSPEQHKYNLRLTAWRAERMKQLRLETNV